MNKWTLLISGVTSERVCFLEKKKKSFGNTNQVNWFKTDDLYLGFVILKAWCTITWNAVSLTFCKFVNKIIMN